MKHILVSIYKIKIHISKKSFDIYFFSVGLQSFVYNFKCASKIWSPRLCALATSYLQGSISNCNYDAFSWHIDHSSDFGTSKHSQSLKISLVSLCPSTDIFYSCLTNSSFLEMCISRAKRRAGQSQRRKGRTFQCSAK